MVFIGGDQCPTWDRRFGLHLADGSSLCPRFGGRLSDHRIPLVAPRWLLRIWFSTLLSVLVGDPCTLYQSYVPLTEGRLLWGSHCGQISLSYQRFYPPIPHNINQAIELIILFHLDPSWRRGAICCSQSSCLLQGKEQGTCTV